MFSSAQAGGLESLDMMFVEVDAGVGDLLSWLMRYDRSPSSTRQMRWAGGFCAGGCDRSATQRVIHVEKLMEQHRHDQTMNRTLKRQPSDNGLRLEALVVSPQHSAKDSGYCKIRQNILGRLAKTGDLDYAILWLM